MCIVYLLENKTTTTTTNSPADWMLADKSTELSRIKLKNLNSTARPYDQRAFSPLGPLSVDFRTWLWRYTCLLLLILMLWHRHTYIHTYIQTNKQTKKHTYIHTHTHIYIYIYYVYAVHFDPNGPSNLPELVPVIGMEGIVSRACVHWTRRKAYVKMAWNCIIFCHDSGLNLASCARRHVISCTTKASACHYTLDANRWHPLWKIPGFKPDLNTLLLKVWGSASRASVTWWRELRGDNSHR